MISRLLDLLILVVPVVLEYFKKQREENESPVAYVKRQQEQELKTLEALQKGDGGELSRNSLWRMRVIAERLRRKGIKPTDGKSRVRSEGTRLRGTVQPNCPMSPSRRNDDQ